MSNAYYIGKSAKDVDVSKEFLPYSKVVIIAGEDENNNQLVYEAGDNSGRTIETKIETFVVPQGQTSAQAGQALANAILAQINGYVYKPYSAQDAFVPDDAELGDGVTIGGIYSVLASQDITFDGLMSSDIEASGADETDNEFGDYTPKSNREVKRKIASVRSSIRTEIDAITLDVTNDATGHYSTLTLKDGSGATIATSGQITLGGTVVFTSNLTDGTTTISGNNIKTGSIFAGSLNGNYTSINTATGILEWDMQNSKMNSFGTFSCGDGFIYPKMEFINGSIEVTNPNGNSAGIEFTTQFNNQQGNLMKLSSDNIAIDGTLYVRTDMDYSTTPPTPRQDWYAYGYQDGAVIAASDSNSLFSVQTNTISVLTDGSIYIVDGTPFFRGTWTSLEYISGLTWNWRYVHNGIIL